MSMGASSANDCSFVTEAVPLYVMNDTPVGLFRFSSAMLYLFFSFLIIYWIKKQERNARDNLYQNNDDDDAVQSGTLSLITIIIDNNSYIVISNFSSICSSIMGQYIC
jgi:hypothetical protein